jgi:hypothetical protein
MVCDRVDIRGAQVKQPVEATTSASLAQELTAAGSQSGLGTASFAAPTVLVTMEGPIVDQAASIAVHHLDSPHSPQLKALVDAFPENSVFRIINEHFVETALRTGTDKGDVETRDVRRLTGEAGYDVWGVESNLAEQGLSKADVFCGTPKEFFWEGSYKTAGLGLPPDRSAILVFDGAQVTPMGETDGYRFNNPKEKMSALLGVIQFAKQLRPFEHEMSEMPGLPDKISILEREVHQGLQVPSDLRDRGDLLSVLLTNALYDAPPGPEADRLLGLARDLKQRSFLIENWGNLQSQLEDAARVPSNEDPRRKSRRLRQPDFIIRSSREFLTEHPLMPAEFVLRYQKLIADAEALKQASALAAAEARST